VAPRFGNLFILIRKDSIPVPWSEKGSTYRNAVVPFSIPLTRITLAAKRRQNRSKNCLLSPIEKKNHSQKFLIPRTRTCPRLSVIPYDLLTISPCHLCGPILIACSQVEAPNLSYTRVCGTPSSSIKNLSLVNAAPPPLALTLQAPLPFINPSSFSIRIGFFFCEHSLPQSASSASPHPSSHPNLNQFGLFP